MERSTRQIIAGGLVAATVIPYLGYAIGGEMPFIQDARGMAFTGLVLGTVAWFILGVRAFGARWLGIGGAAVAATLGIVAAALETGTASACSLACSSRSSSLCTSSRSTSTSTTQAAGRTA